jgi:sulfofructose kinase
LVFRTTSLPNGSGKSFASGLSEVGGGPASSAAVCVARLGGQATFAGRTGGDAAGTRVREELQREGVDTRWLRSFSGFQTSVSAISVDAQGERAILAYSDPAMPVDADWLAPDLEPGVVLADLTWPAGALTLLQRARAQGWPAVLDADRFRHPLEVVREVVAAATDVIFSRPGLAQLAGHDDIAQGLQSVGGPHRLVAVTDGESGVFWIEDGALHCQRPPPVQASDTTGAGDAFHGAYALAVARGETVLHAMRFATAVAAAKCTRPGGRAGLPDPTALADFLRTHPLPETQTLALAR